LERLLRSSVLPPATTVLEIEAKVHEGLRAARHPGTPECTDAKAPGEIPTTAPVLLLPRQGDQVTPRPS
jgi:hypothetical protein